MSFINEIDQASTFTEGSVVTKSYGLKSHTCPLNVILILKFSYKNYLLKFSLLTSTLDVTIHVNFHVNLDHIICLVRMAYLLVVPMKIKFSNSALNMSKLIVSLNFCKDFEFIVMCQLTNKINNDIQISNDTFDTHLYFFDQAKLTLEKHTAQN